MLVPRKTPSLHRKINKINLKFVFSQEVRNKNYSTIHQPQPTDISFSFTMEVVAATSLVSYSELGTVVITLIISLRKKREEAI